MEKTLANFRAMMEEVAQKYEVNIDECCKKMARILSQPIDPSVEFDFLGSGCYKQTYRLTNDLVIKFVDEQNRTKDEMDAYNAAKEWRLDGVFADTWVCECHIPIELWDLRDRDGYYVGDPGGYVQWIVIQEQIDRTTDDDDDECHEWVEYNQTYVIGNRMIDFYFPCTDLTWLNKIVDCYGEEYFDKFVDFVAAVKISDLHGGNIAYNMKNQPVIIDWLSK